MRKIRCSDCGAIIAIERDDGSITVMCNHRRESGQRCKTVNVIARKQLNIPIATGIDTINQERG